MSGDDDRVWAHIPFGAILSLEQIRALGGFAERDGVEEQTHDFGIADTDRCWRLEMFSLHELSGWWANPELSSHDDAYVADMATVYTSGGRLPPIIVVRHPPGKNAPHQTVTPLDGSHRISATLKVGRNEIPAWVTDQPNQERP